MKKILSLMAACLLLFVSVLQVQAQLRSFPGAEGAGSFTSGGRGTAQTMTTVFEVTNLTDVNSPGSLRYACSQSINIYPHRTIVFRVAGIIHLNSKLNIPGNTTIAGQTAPGDGICIADYPVSINGNNVIIRYIRVRMGDKNQLKTSPSNCGLPVAPFTDACKPIDGSGGDDALGDLGHKNIIIDHCSVSWSNDEALTIYRGDSLTIQWTIISEPLNYSYHFETGDTDFEQHGYGGIWGAQHASFHHNLFAHCRNRTPRFAGNSTYPAGARESADFRNNVLFNWGINNIYGGDGGEYNLVNNYYKYGPNTSAGVRYRIVTVDKSDAFPFARYYLSGNYVDGSSTNTNNNWTGAYMSSNVQADTVLSKTNSPFLADYLPATTQTAAEAFDTVMKAAGCIIPVRDTLDLRITNNVKNRTGRIIDVQGGFPHGTPFAETVNAWPTLATGVAQVDTDHDGMPDEWENGNGLNPNNAADRGVFAPNGYTNLENYLNSITSKVVIDPVPPTGTPASAMWPLLTDQAAVNTGNVSGSNQQLGSYLSGISYGSSFAGIAGWQRVATTSYLPIGYTDNSYVEYKLTPTDGKSFTATSISFSALGGGTGTAKLAVYYSLDDFATSFPAGSCNYNGQNYGATIADSVSLLNTSTSPLTGQQVATISTNIKVEPSQTLSVRMYVWISGTGNRYFTSQLVNIAGLTNDVALPLQLKRFSAAVLGSSTLLSWQTNNEQNMLRFEVEKSEDGRSFKSIGVVGAYNNAVSDYTFNDISPIKNVSYYRLKIVGKDGGITYSYVLVINNNQKGKVFVYPNPASQIITIKHDLIQRAATATVFNIDGKKLMTLPLAANSTQNSFSIEQLARGNYILQYQDDQQVQTIKFSRQ